MQKGIIEEKEANQRIDKFLKKEFFLNEPISRGEIIRIIKEGRVLIDGEKIKPSYVLKAGDSVEIIDFEKINAEKKELISNSKIKFEIVFENENIVIIEKPAGLSVHGSNFDDKNTLVNGLLDKFPEILGVGEDPLRPGIVHRLDKETSGLMVIARNQKTFLELKRKFRNHEVEKVYVAVVWGHIFPRTGTIKKPIARAGSYKKQVIAGRKTKTKIREAITEYAVLESGKNVDLVEARPKTGRMHQIRVHLFSLGHPIVGDRLYKLRNLQDKKDFSRHLLHAKSLSFELFGEKYHFESEIPEIFTLTDGSFL